MIQPNSGEINNAQPVEAGYKNLDTLKVDLLQNYLNGSLILGTIVFFINLYISVQGNDVISSIATLLLFVTLFLITFLRKIDPILRTLLLSFVFFVTGIFSLLVAGLNANGMLYFFISVLILGMLGPRSWWITGLVITGITSIVIGILVQANLINNGNFIIDSNSILNWIATFIILLFLIYVILYPTNRFLAQSIKLLQNSRNTELALNYDNSTLTDRVQSLEGSIDRRRSNLVSGRQIIRSISEKTNPEELIQEATDLIKSQFGYYFVGIFLPDEAAKYAVLHGATGAAGKAMLSRNHRVILRESIIGFVISQGEPRIVLDVASDLLYTKNTDLPDTKSEIALPLKVGNQTIGVLDVHSDKENYFSQEDVDVLQTTADQLAILFEKTIQIEKLQSSETELREALSAYSETTWRTHLQGSKKAISYQFSGSNLEKKEQVYPQELEVIRNKTKLIVNNSDSSIDKSESALLVPIMLRDQTLGVLNIKYSGKSIPKELEKIVETTSARLAIALENARLLEDIQDRADREKVVGTISNKVRSSKDIDGILQTTVAELGRSLGVSEIRIQLKTQEIEK